MVNTKDLFVILLLIVSTISLGCSNDNQDSRTSPPSNNIENNNQLVRNKSCMITLVPHVGEERIDEEIVNYQNKITTATNSIPYLERLGWAYISKARISFDAGYYTLADQTALCIEAVDPNSLEALLLRGHVLHSLHEFKESEKIARQLVDLRGRWFDYGLLGDVLMEQGKLDEAVLAYEKMMDQKPGPQAYSRAAHIRWLIGDLAGAIQLMELAARAHHPANTETTAWAYTRLAIYLLQAAHYEEAMFYTEAALSLQNNYAPALFAQSRILLAQNMSSEAIALLGKTVELSSLPEYQWLLIDAICQHEQCADASLIKSELLEFGAKNDSRTFSLYLASTGLDTKRALRLVERELEVRKDIHTWDAYAWALLAEGQTEEAYKFIQQALEEGVQDARIFYHAGIISAAVGYQQEAINWLKHADVLKHMLMPSEQKHLILKFATLQSQKPTLALHDIQAK